MSPGSDALKVVMLAMLSLASGSCYRADIPLDADSGHGDSDSESDSETTEDTADEQACLDVEADPSTVGCEFYAVHILNDVPDQPLAVALTNPGEHFVHALIERREADSWDVIAEDELEPGTAARYDLGETSPFGNFLLPEHAFRITTSRPVAAFQFNPYDISTQDDFQFFSADATPLIPTASLGRRHIVPTYPPSYMQPILSVIATEDGTNVSVTPSVDITGGGNATAIQAGTVQVFAMDSSSTLQLIAEGDLSGTVVEADKPIAVFGAHKCACVPQVVENYCDHLEHAIPPVTAWGNEHIAARSPVRSSTLPPENDYWRVIASEGGTHIETEPSVPGLDGQTLDAGQVIEVGVNYSFVVSANAPVLIGQFTTGHASTDVPWTEPGGDPAFATIPPVAQFRRQHTLMAPPDFPEHYVVITHPAADFPTLDGDDVSTLSGCETEPVDAVWSVTRCRVAPDLHVVEAQEPIAVAAFGYGPGIAYAYTVGFGLAEINPSD